MREIERRLSKLEETFGRGDETEQVVLAGGEVLTLPHRAWGNLLRAVEGKGREQLNSLIKERMAREALEALRGKETCH